jgi:UDP-N-acetylmuramyl pentapeptide phosphotransferase/UDP-N-acetylglucosamine-1-phosphate transferase
VGRVLAFVAGGLAAALGWQLLRPVLSDPRFARTNHRGRTVATAGGLALVGAVVTVVAAEAVATTHWRGGAAGATARLLTVAAVVGFALAGLVDDLAGDVAHRGFKGHVGALVHGRLTTGGFKLVAGALVAVVVVGPVSGGLGGLVRDALLVAFAANLANLLDRAPGRTGKVVVVTGGVLVAVHLGHPALDGVAAALGASVALLVPDLREQMMLGDTGANAAGAAVGLGAVLACAPATRLVVVLVVGALNLVSEKVSFSRVIEATPPLRFVDRLGRRL